MTLMHDTFTSCLDYCSSLLFCLLAFALAPHLFILNRKARVIMLNCKAGQVSAQFLQQLPALQSLWQLAPLAPPICTPPSSTLIRPHCLPALLGHAKQTHASGPHSCHWFPLAEVLFHRAPRADFLSLPGFSRLPKVFPPHLRRSWTLSCLTLHFSHCVFIFYPVACFTSSHSIYLTSSYVVFFSSTRLHIQWADIFVCFFHSSVFST